jgi:hypothetical protein
MRFMPCIALALVLLLPSAVSAQQISLAGWVDRVDAANATLTIRTLDMPRTLQVAPNAAIRINGVVSRLDQLPFNSPVSIIAEKDANGVLHVTQISAQTTGRQPAAAAPPGAIVRGTLVGIDIPQGRVTVRTPAGDYPVALGTASIYVNGAVGSSRDLRLGQMVEIDRIQPTPASSDFVTQAVRVLPPGGAAVTSGAAAARSRTAATGARAPTSGTAGTRAASPAIDHLTGAGTVDRGYVRTRTRAYTALYRPGRTRTLHRVRRTRSRTGRHRIRRRTRSMYPSQPM